VGGVTDRIISSSSRVCRRAKVKVKVHPFRITTPKANMAVAAAASPDPLPNIASSCQENPLPPATASPRNTRARKPPPRNASPKESREYSARYPSIDPRNPPRFPRQNNSTTIIEAPILMTNTKTVLPTKEDAVARWKLKKRHSTVPRTKITPLKKMPS